MNKYLPILIMFRTMGPIKPYWEISHTHLKQAVQKRTAHMFKHFQHIEYYQKQDNRHKMKSHAKFHVTKPRLN